MTLIEYRERYAGLSSASVRELIKTDTSFKSVTEDLYVSVFHQPLNKKCSECWMDAYVLLMKSEVKSLMEKKERKFELRNGALLIDVVAYDNDKMCSTHNLTDELALYHLSTNPSCIRLFAKYPENWEDLVAAYKGEKPSKAGAKGGDDKSLSPEVENAQKAVKKALAAVRTDETLLAKAKQGDDAEKIAKLEKRLSGHKDAFAEAEAALAKLTAE